MTAPGDLRPPVLVVALDLPSYERAAHVVGALGDLPVTYKIGYEAFYGYGERIRSDFEASGRPYVLDLKVHDIPRTAAAAVRAVVRPGVRALTVHALGGAEMLAESAAAAAERAAELGIAAPEVLAVTILTSLGEADLGELGLSGGPGENAIRLAALARDARCAGVVCSVAEVAELKSFFGHELRTLCPGVRPAGSAHGDQRRVATPRDARAAGADYVVVGRPIVDDRDPATAARAILDELGTVAR